MNLMRNVLLLLIVGLFIQNNSVYAQVKSTAKYDLYCLIPKANDDLSQANLKILESKIVHGFKSIGYTGTGTRSTFVVYPEINVSEEGVSENGVKNIGLYQVNITFVSKDIIQNRIFNSVEFSTPSAGNTKEIAVRKAFLAIDANIAFESFIRDSFLSIDQYYSTNCESFKDLSAALEIEGKYEDAIAVLRTIPTTATCYKSNIASIGRIIKAKNNQLCKELMISANADFASGDHLASLIQLKSINPNADCYKDALAMIEKIGAKVTDKEVRQAEKEAKIRQEENDFRKYEMESTKEIIKAYLERFTFTYNYDHLPIK
jgi:hypothetical protein